MKGILLAGGLGTRLYPCTHSISKQMLPVYDKPAIYYPLSNLMQAGIKDIVVISSPRDLPMIRSLFAQAGSLGLDLEFVEQPEPKGIAQAFLVAEDYIRGQSTCLILGDNIFYGAEMESKLRDAASSRVGASVFAYHVNDPQRYGVVQFDANKKAICIEEKPQEPKSNWAVTGLYFYDETAVERVKSLEPSARGELEITDLNISYLKEGKLHVHELGTGYTWLDSGTSESLLEASQFVQALEKRTGKKVACIEEVALKMGFASYDKLHHHVSAMPSNEYGHYVRRVLEKYR